MTGKFIVFEGINGSGKGVQLEKITEWLYNTNKSNLILRTREPNEINHNGVIARKLLETSSNPYESAKDCVEHFARNRLSHNLKIIQPFLENYGSIVLCDRYWHSNFSYQKAQGRSYEEIKRVNSQYGLLVPDLTIIFDVDAETAFERLNIRRDKKRKFDSDKDFLKRVRNNYLELKHVLNGFDDSIVYVNSGNSIDDVFNETKNLVNKYVLEK